MALKNYQEIKDYRKRAAQAVVWMAGSGDPESTKTALELIRGGVDVNSRSSATACLGQTPLMSAAGSANYKVVKKLLSLSADVNASDHIGWTPLLFACKHTITDRHDPRLIKLLVERGANANARTRDNYNAIRILVHNEGLRVDPNLLLNTCEWLIQHGCKFTEADCKRILDKDRHYNLRERLPQLVELSKSYAKASSSRRKLNDKVETITGTIESDVELG